MRRQQPVDERLQPVGLADHHLRVFDQLRPVELALEELRRAANAAERILDLVREVADQLAVRLLLLVQPLLARDLQLLVDVPELEQQRGVVRVDRRHRAREVELRLAGDAELELLLGVGRAARDRLVDRGVEARGVGEDLPRAMADQMLLRELEQVLGGRVRVDDAARAIEQQHRGREQLEAGVRNGRVAPPANMRIGFHRGHARKRQWLRGAKRHRQHVAISAPAREAARPRARVVT